MFVKDVDVTIIFLTVVLSTFIIEEKNTVYRPLFPFEDGVAHIEAEVILVPAVAKLFRRHPIAL